MKRVWFRLILFLLCMMITGCSGVSLESSQPVSAAKPQMRNAGQFIDQAISQVSQLKGSHLQVYIDERKKYAGEEERNVVNVECKFLSPADFAIKGQGFELIYKAPWAYFKKGYSAKWKKQQLKPDDPQMKQILAFYHRNNPQAILLQLKKDEKQLTMNEQGYGYVVSLQIKNQTDKMIPYLGDSSVQSQLQKELSGNDIKNSLLKVDVWFDHNGNLQKIERHHEIDRVKETKEKVDLIATTTIEWEGKIEQIPLPKEVERAEQENGEKELFFESP